MQHSIARKEEYTLIRPVDFLLDRSRREVKIPFYSLSDLAIVRQLQSVEGYGP